MTIYIDTNNQLHDIDENFTHLLPAGCVVATQAQITASQAPTPAQVKAQLVASAQALLDTSDKVATRCIKAGVSYPAEWHTVDIANRNIVNGSDTTSTTAVPLPTTYPAGT